MQRSAPLTVSLLTTAALFHAGCSDLGDCDDPAKGRTLVKIGSRLSYTGQAIITQSCTVGCHNSGATGSFRKGAPADLNFDLNPLDPGTPITDSTGKVTGVQVDPAARAKLREHQRTVHEQREAIWDQVQKGLMPPSSTPMFKELARLIRTKLTGQSMCPDGQALVNLDKDKEELRKWLACDTPVVETSSPDLPYQPVPANAPPEDQAAGSVYYSIDNTVGYQYPSCGASSGGDAGAGGPSFSELYKDIFEMQCKLCHYTGSVLNSTLDFQTEDIAYMELLGANGMGGATSCTAMNPNPFVTPGKPEQSYLLTKVGAQQGTICGTLMPTPPGLAKEDADRIKAWIMAGALRTPAGGGGGGDAGVADAGM